MKKINFILPATNDRPIGGYKIVYQYANELCRRGYNITVNFLYRVEPITRNFLFQKIRRTKRVLLHQKLPAKEITWFDLNPKIQLKFDVISLNDISDGDIVIATAAPTANFVKRLSSQKGKKYYFIQNFETWWYNNVDELNKTFKLGLTNIVVSKDLQKRVELASGVTPNFLPDFYDEHEFFLTQPIKERPLTVSLLNHIQETKRTKFGLEILSEVQKQLPSLQVLLFGAYQPIEKLPSFVKFIYKANSKQLRSEIYGKSSVYLLPSSLEGWGLTGTEAMACGAVVVASRIGGIEEYANDYNSFLVDVKDKKKFVDSVIYLLTHNAEREKMAKLALRDVRNFTLKKSTDKFEKILLN